MNVLQFITELICTDEVYLQTFIQNKVIYSLLKRGVELCKNLKEKTDDLSRYLQMELLLGLFVETSLNQKGREYLVEKNQFLLQIFRNTFEDHCEKKKKYLFLYVLLFKTLSNCFFNQKEN